MDDERDVTDRERRRAPHIPLTGRIMGIDWGTRRIGLAITDPTQTIGQPLATLTRREGKRFPLSSLRPYLDENDVVGVIVGLPLDADGAETDASRAARRAGALIAEKSELPVAFHDERFTTSHALAAIREMGGSTRGRREKVDQLSAAIILQAFLDRRAS